MATTYVPEKPCPHGHWERYRRDDRCAKCLRQAARELSPQQAQRRREYMRQYREGERGMLHAALNRARNKAKARQVVGPIGGMRALAEHYEKVNKRCELTGRPFANTKDDKPYMARITPEHGYAPDNVRLVCANVGRIADEYGVKAAKTVFGVTDLGDLV